MKKQEDLRTEYRMVGGMLATVHDLSGRNTIKPLVEYVGGVVHVDVTACRLASLSPEAPEATLE